MAVPGKLQLGQQQWGWGLCLKPSRLPQFGWNCHHLHPELLGQGTFGEVPSGPFGRKVEHERLLGESQPFFSEVRHPVPRSNNFAMECMSNVPQDFVTATPVPSRPLFFQPRSLC